MDNKFITLYRGVSYIDGQQIIEDKVVTCSDSEHYRRETLKGYVYLTRDIGVALRYASLSESSLKNIFPCYIFKIEIPVEILEIDEQEKAKYGLKKDFFYRSKGNLNLKNLNVYYAIVESIEEKTNSSFLLSWINNYSLDEEDNLDKKYGKEFENLLCWKNLN